MLTVSDAVEDIRTAYTFGVSSFTNKPDSDKDWIAYFQLLRVYWFETITLPKIYFSKQD